MPPTICFPLRWESTGDQWWYATPIDWAAANGHYDLVRELLHLDANLLFKLTSLRRIRRLESVWDDEEPFNDAARCRSQVAQKLLLESENKKGHNSLIGAGYGGWLLYTAASAGDIGFVKELLERDPLLVFGEREYGVTDILYAAARSKSSEVFRLLLDSCLSYNGEGLEGKEEETPSVFRLEMMNRAVHAAARGGNVKILCELLGDCTDVLVYRDAQGSTLLHTASGRGQIEVVKYLVASYDIINSVDKQGNTPLHVAAFRGNLSAVEFLVSTCPSSTFLTNNYGDTFLHMAMAGFRTPGFRRLDKQVELVKKLVCENLANIEDIINLKNNDGRTALHMAISENMPSDLVELLMTVMGINLNIRDAEGMTPLDLLKRRSRSASSALLIKQLILAGGISNYLTRSALVSHLRMQGIGESPGTSFRISDAEIIFYADAENNEDNNCDAQSTDYDSCSGDLSRFDTSVGPNSSENTRSGTVNDAAPHLKLLLKWPRKKEGKFDDSTNMGIDDSLKSYSVNGASKYTQFSLRQRYMKHSSFPHNKRVLSLKSILPSPSTKKKFTAELMQGVLQVTPQSGVESPSSRFSESARSSPASNYKQEGGDIGNEGAAPSCSNSLVDKQRAPMNSMLKKRLMNKYFSFGAQGHALRD